MNIPKDKALHVAAGAAIAFVVGLAIAPAAGFLAGLLAGLAKEGYDLHQNEKAARRHVVPPHSVEAADVFATVVGAVLGAVAAWIVS